MFGLLCFSVIWTKIVIEEKTSLPVCLLACLPKLLSYLVITTLRKKIWNISSLLQYIILIIMSNYRSPRERWARSREGSSVAATRKRSRRGAEGRGRGVPIGGGVRRRLTTSRRRYIAVTTPRAQYRPGTARDHSTPRQDRCELRIWISLP